MNGQVFLWQKKVKHALCGGYGLTQAEKVLNQFPLDTNTTHKRHEI